MLAILLLSHPGESARRPTRHPAGIRLQAARRKRHVRKSPRSRKVVKWVTATAYCLGPCGRCETRGRTYTGAKRRRGIAVARKQGRRVVPLGTRVSVPGYGAAEVDDVGGGVGRTQIDLRFRTHQLASRWGKRKLKVVAMLQ
jgi:3D (Asp-Asp-Asp) domain-containing protein